MPANRRWSSSFRGTGIQNRFGSNRGFQDNSSLGRGNMGGSSDFGAGYTRRDRSGSQFGGRGAIEYSSQGFGPSGIVYNQGRNMSAMSSNNPMVNPWASGVIPMGGAGIGSHGGDFLPPTGGSGTSLLGEYRGGGAADLVGSIRHLSQMNNPESKLALNILNTVLSTRASESQNQIGWSSGPPANKMMCMDVGGGYDNYRGQTLAPSMHQPARKFPQRDHQFGPRRAGDNLSPRRGRGGRFLGQAGRQMTTEQQSKKTLNVKKGTAKNSKGLEKEKDEESTPASTGDQKGDKTEGDGSSATADPKQSGKVLEDTDDDDDDDDDGIKKEAQSIDSSAETKDTSDSQESKSRKDPPPKFRSDGLIPKEALQCHMCNFYQFNSLQGFKNHLESRNHEQMERSFHAKGVAVLNLLRAQAKVSSQRNILKMRRMGMKGRISTCPKCDCSFMGSIYDHNKTREHYLINHYTKCSPCRIWFDNRADLEKHRLSHLHLKKQMKIDADRLEKASKAKKTEEDKIPEHESMKKVHDAVAKLKITHSIKNVWNKNRIPFYDPAVPIGLNFIMKKSNYYCKICPNKTVQSAKEALAHFCSREHYGTYAAHLKSLEEKRKLEEMKEEENVDVNEQTDSSPEEKEHDEKDTLSQEKEKQSGEADGGDDADGEADGDANDVEMVDEETDKANVITSSSPAKKTQKNGDEYYGDILDRLDLDMMEQDDTDDEQEADAADAAKTSSKTDDRNGQNNTDILNKNDGSGSSVIEEALSDSDETKKNGSHSSGVKDDKSSSSRKDKAGNGVNASTVEVDDETKSDEGEKSEDECEAPSTLSTPRRKARGRGRGRVRGTRK
nr:uncharacterized protein LOC123768420 isoform X3 [Procambarus clarkii]